MITLGQLLEGKGSAVYSVVADAQVIEAVRTMAEKHVGALLVMEGARLIGVVSERDYARKCVLMGRSSADTPVRDIMSAPVISITPGETVEDAMRVMTQQRIRHLPVIEAGKIHGVVSIGDLVKSVIEDQRHLIEDLQTYIRG
ncbi:MAG: CBS domain-containing protein [Pseudomonadota bacterium]